MLEPLFNKVADLKVCKFIKKETQAKVFSCKYSKNFQNTYVFQKVLASRSDEGVGKK